MTTYAVNDIYATIQGEGVHTGTPTVFVRLHGCSVGCSFCDTKETWYFSESARCDTIEAALGANPRYSYQTAESVAGYVSAVFPNLTWVVITGGEPANYDLCPLVTALKAVGKKIAVETSGTAAGHVNAGLDWITVSPKIGQPGGLPIIPEAVEVADEIKHVVGISKHVNQLKEFIACLNLKPTCVICLQPMSQSSAATALCVRVCLQMNWRLSIQTHKLIHLP